ncbi:MAG: 2-deoxyribose-5-phosphate aldolase [Candidatus Aegiribacteria sp. MLS_C]|nr:MAG: 2-deoxyribose-5-phosphate aldolase [Candidatus Aegiribacteria sp. MLS_C]
MDRRTLASMIDHTQLRPDAGRSDIERLCRQTLEYGFAAACVNPLWVSLASDLLRNGSPLVCSVIGFPLGASVTMADEASRALDNGAGELDMVIPLGLLKSGMTNEAAKTIEEVVKASSGVPVKVILETCLLTDGEKVIGCRLAMDAGASWVKTSTGFGGGGATVEDVALMRSVVGEKLGVKASGGIGTLEKALSMIEAGAGRLGCSRSVQIIESIRE